MNSLEGNGGNSEQEAAGSGSAANLHNRDTCVVGWEDYTGTDTWGRLGPLVLAVALGAICPRTDTRERKSKKVKNSASTH